MVSQRLIRRKRSSSSSSPQLNPGGWFVRRYQLLREFLALARQNGATKDFTSLDTDDEMSSASDLIHIQEEKLVAMEDRFPTSTDMERLRFLRACKGKLQAANKKLQAYLDWRELHGLDSPEYQEAKLRSTSDEQDWEESCELALKYAEKTGLMEEYSKKKGNRSFSKSKSKTKLPQIVFVYTDEHGHTKNSLNGNVILHVMPPRLDKRKTPCEVYSLALGLYLDRKQNREALGLFSVMLDVRGGKGWANPPAYNMMPFIKSAATLLHEFYPERLDKLMVYPLPRAALWIWHMVKPFLDASVVSSAHLIGGKDSCTAPPPNDRLSEFVAPELLDELEASRLSLYKESAKKSGGQ